MFVKLAALLSLSSVLLPRRRATTEVPEYRIRVWDKPNGDFLINAVHDQCSQCSWYHDIRGVRTRVSNATVLDLTQDSEYGEYYLLDDQGQSALEYVLVVPNSNAGLPFESNFLRLHACRIGMSNVEFWYTININERAIDTRQHCDLRWNGLPHCEFGDRPCSYNGSDLTVKFSVRCRLDAEEDNYISSFPIMIGQVASCPSESTFSITYGSITISPTSTLVLPTHDIYTQPAPTNTKIINTTSMISTSSAANVMYQTVTLTSTSVNHMPSGLTTFNATHETSTPSPSATTSEQRRNIIIAVVCVIVAIILFLLFLPLLVVQVDAMRKTCKGRSNSSNENNIRLQPRWKQEINKKRVDMAESLTTVILTVLWNLRELLSPYEYNEINSIANEMRKAYVLLDTICSREDDKLLIKFCDALERENHHRWTYLRDYCNNENYDV